MAVSKAGSSAVIAPVSGAKGADWDEAANALGSVEGFDAVCCEGEEDLLRAIRVALASRQGPLIPLVTNLGDLHGLVLERHVCVDTTASGGNAQLLAAQSGN